MRASIAALLIAGCSREGTVARPPAAAAASAIAPAGPHPVLRAPPAPVAGERQALAPPRALRSDGRCDGDLGAATAGRCLCEAKQECAVETVLAVDAFRAAVSIVFRDVVEGMGEDLRPHAELWMMRNEGDVVAFQLLGRNEAMRLDAPARSWDELSVADGTLTWSGSHPWREAHDSNLTGHVRFRLALADMRPSIERWDWRRCCSTINGQLVGFGFDSVCQQHYRTDPYSLMQSIDWTLKGKRCRPFVTRSIPQVSLVSLEPTMALGDCARWEGVGNSRFGAVWVSDDALIIEAHDEAWGRFTVSMAGTDWEDPADLGESWSFDAEGNADSTAPKDLRVTVVRGPGLRRFRVQSKALSSRDASVGYRRGATSFATSEVMIAKGHPLSRSLSSRVTSPLVECAIVSGALEIERKTPRWDEPLFAE